VHPALGTRLTADLSFYYFSNPPFRLSFHLCESRCTGACVSFPCGIFRGTSGSSGWSRVRSAADQLLWIVYLHAGLSSKRLTPLCSRTMTNNDTMSSISSSPQGVVGQSHSSRFTSQAQNEALLKNEREESEKSYQTSAFECLFSLPSHQRRDGGAGDTRV
jgi:hypothetical protein